MATTILNGLIIEASRMVQEYRTDGSVNGDANKRWKSANWTDYVNRALRDLLRTKLEEMGPEKFMEMFPEYVKPSGVLTLVAGAVAKPSDALFVFDLVKSDYTVKFERLIQDDVVSVLSGVNGLYEPSATKPVFWDESGTIKTLGLTTGNVIAKYVVSPADLAVITGAAGSGKKNSANGSFTVATNTLTIAMAGNFVAGTDENRKVMFFDNAATKVYWGTIKSIPTTGSAVLEGSGLPIANIAAGNVTIALMEQAESPDVLLNAIWRGELVQQIVKYAQNDTLPVAVEA